MPGRHTRNLIRALTGTALCTALVACAVVPVPEELPAVAFRQAGFYRLEVALLVFYGGLLLITPAFSGLFRGRLPIEISTRGAKFAEETDQTEALNGEKIEELKRTTDALAEDLTTMELEIERLVMGRSDSTQPAVGSKP